MNLLFANFIASKRCVGRSLESLCKALANEVLPVRFLMTFLLKPYDSYLSSFVSYCICGYTFESWEVITDYYSQALHKYNLKMNMLLV